jgi:hypothetical protein
VKRRRSGIVFREPMKSHPNPASPSVCGHSPGRADDHRHDYRGAGPSRGTRRTESLSDRVSPLSFLARGSPRIHTAPMLQRRMHAWVGLAAWLKEKVDHDQARAAAADSMRS